METSLKNKIIAAKKEFKKINDLYWSNYNKILGENIDANHSPKRGKNPDWFCDLNDKRKELISFLDKFPGSRQEKKNKGLPYCNFWDFKTPKQLKEELMSKRKAL